MITHHRNYPLAKIQDNNEAEIMEVVLTEARDAYPAEAIVVLQSESNDDVETNVAQILQWIQSWRTARGFTPE
jgi:adenylate kinase